MLAGCTASRLHHDGLVLIKSGKIEAGLSKLAKASDEAPNNIIYRSDYIKQRDKQVEQLLVVGKTQLSAGDWDKASASFERARTISPLDSRPQDALSGLHRARVIAADLDQARADLRHGDLGHAEQIASTVNAQDPGNRVAADLLRQIEEIRAKDHVDNPTLHASSGKLVTLHFVDASVRMILEAISRLSGLTIMIDKDIRPDLLASIAVDKVSAEDAIGLVLQTSHLRSKVMDGNTVLIYPATPEKIKDLEDLAVKGFYLANANPRSTEALLKGILKGEDIFVDEKRNLLIVRGPVEQIRLAEKLVALDDVREPEVMLEVQVMEIDRSRLTDLGITFPNQITASVLPSSTSSGTTLTDYLNIKPSVIGLSVPSPVLNLSTVVTDADLLANPRIRVRNREHAKILIGDKLPQVTSTATSTGFVSENIQYIDVGLKLDVEPNISLDDTVAININLEVSTVVKEITTPGGSQAYDIGTRNASTVLELKDGETEVLAGLINDNDTRIATNLPGLGDLPVLGRLFSNHNNDHEKTEIILTITPHIVRDYRPTVATDSQFWSGTENQPRTEAFVLHRADAGKKAPERPGDTAPDAKAGGVPAAAANGTPGEPTPPEGPAATSVGLTWQGPDRVKVGDTFTVTLHVKSDGAVHALPTQIAYDSKALQVVQVDEGGYFRTKDSQSLFASSIDQSASKVLISAGRSGTEGMTGEGDLCVLTFKALAANERAQVRVIGSAPVLTDGQPLSASSSEPFTIAVTN
jgi:general secretion pathway protein D